MRPLIAVLANMLRNDGGEFSLLDIANRPYHDAVVAAGGIPFIIPCTEDAEAVTALLNMAHGILMTGGADVGPGEYGEEPHASLGSILPLRDSLDRLVVEYAQKRPHLPPLGICRGIQSLAVFAGGTLYQDIAAQVEGHLQHSQKAPGDYGLHWVTLAPDSLLAGLTGESVIATNSFHHQAVRDLPPGFRAVGHAPDGVIEAIERPDADFCLGVQFHPELMVKKHRFAAALFSAFCTAARDYAATRTKA